MLEFNAHDPVRPYFTLGLLSASVAADVRINCWTMLHFHEGLCEQGQVVTCVAVLRPGFLMLGLPHQCLECLRPTNERISLLLSHPCVHEVSESTGCTSLLA